MGLVDSDLSRYQLEQAVKLLRWTLPKDGVAVELLQGISIELEIPKVRVIFLSNQDRREKELYFEFIRCSLYSGIESARKFRWKHSAWC